MLGKNIKNITESISLLKWYDLILVVLIILGITFILFKLFPQMCNYTPCSNSELFTAIKPRSIKNGLETRQKPQRHLQESDELEEIKRTNNLDSIIKRVRSLKPTDRTRAPRERTRAPRERTRAPRERTRSPERIRSPKRIIPKYKIRDIINNICKECENSPNKISECKKCKIYTNYISSRKDFMNLRKELIKNRKKRVSFNLTENKHFY